MSDPTPTTHTFRFQPPEVIAGQFEIIRGIAASEGGDLYLVRETAHDKQMVLKHLNIPPHAVHDAYEALLQEVKDASVVKHRNLAHIYGLARDGDDLFLASEFIDGQTLSSYLQSRRDQGKGPLTVKAALNLINNLCDAVSLAHDAHLIHGALTPQSIYITDQGRVKITNLLAARIVSRHVSGDRRAALFQSPFLPPEVQGPSDADAQFLQAGDVFALGMLAAQLLIDRSFASSPNPQALLEDAISGLSPSIQGALLNATTADPTQRPQSVARFQARLKDGVGDDTSTSGSGVLSIITAEDIKNMGGSSSPKGPPPKPTSSIAMKLPPKGPPPPKTGDSVALKLGAALPPTPPQQPDAPTSGIQGIAPPLDLSKPISLDRSNLPPPKSGGSISMSLPMPKQGLSFLDGLPEPRSSASSVTNIVSDPTQEVWLVQKDGMDFGPFNVDGVLAMLHKDEIDEQASVLNMLSQQRRPLIDIPEFSDAVIAYLPNRDEKRAKEAAERERRAKQVKAAAGGGGLIGAGIGAFFGISAIIFYLNLPDPEPIEFGKAIVYFKHSLPLTRSEEVKIDLDQDKLKGLLDPNASEEERQRRLNAMREEQRKKLAKDKPAKKGPRRSGRPKPRPAGGGASGAEDEGEYVSSMNFESDAESLDDTEIFDVIYGNRIMGKLTGCIERYSSQASSFTVDFWIRASNGSLGRLKVKSRKGGQDFENCIYDVYQSSVSFREFGGSDKRVNVPYNF
jgi:serine/threonine protein kinase